jgi:hypothetical protein
MVNIYTTYFKIWNFCILPTYYIYVFVLLLKISIITKPYKQTDFCNGEALLFCMRRAKF